MSVPQPLPDSIADLRRRYGEEFEEDLAEHVRRNYPSDAATFIEVLYEDLDQLRVSMAQSTQHFYDTTGKHWTEDQVSNHIATVLDAKGRGRVTTVKREAASRGHVDITVDQQRLGVRWLAEAKVERGPLYLAGGLEQLLRRYASGFEPEVALLIYCFDAKPKTALRDWRAHLVAHRLEGHQSDTDDHDFAFWSVHEHVGTENRVRTRHMVFPLYYKPGR